MRAAVITLIVISVTLFAVGWYISQLDRSEPVVSQFQVETERVEEVITEATFTNIQGEPISLIEEAPRVTILVSWATWCERCVTTLTEIDLLGDNFDIDVKAVNRSESVSTVKSYVAYKEIEFNNAEILFDVSDELQLALTGMDMPTVAILDAQKQIVYKQSGEANIEVIENKLQELFTD